MKHMRKQSYLIGPKLYLYYVRTVKLSLLTGLPVAAALMILFHSANNYVSLSSFIVFLVGFLMTVIMQILFWVTLVFVVFDRSIRR